MTLHRGIITDGMGTQVSKSNAFLISTHMEGDSQNGVSISQELIEVAWTTCSYVSFLNLKLNPLSLESVISPSTHFLSI